MSAFKEIQQLVPAADLAEIDRLEFVANRVVQGLMTGRHHSRMKGGCSEFAEHRAYSAGDEIRRLDWRVAAKCDRYYVKEFHEQSTLSGLIVLDASGSMSFGESTVTKFFHARAAAACLAKLILGQRDSVGLIITGANDSTYLPARSGPSQLLAILDALKRARPGGKTSLLEAVDQTAKLVRSRSQVLLLTDAFVDMDEMEKMLMSLSTRGHQITLFHVLAPEEVSFSFRDGVRFECLEEDGRVMDVDPAVYADCYLQRFQHFLKRLKQGVVRAGGDYQPLPVHQSVGGMLAHYLRRRARGASARS